MLNIKTAKVVLFAAGLLVCLWPGAETWLGLALGIGLSLLLTNPAPALTAKWSKLLLQFSVVGLGFGIGLGQVIEVGKHSILYTLVGIILVMAVGGLLGRLCRVNSKTSQLIAFGTAICGGSAIAAMAPVIKARDEDIAVSLATVFTLNAVGLFLFPVIGHALQMGQHAFGLWAALAIHDTSSVVGAAAAYGPEALGTAVTVKLTRALWISPCVIAVALFMKSDRKAGVPPFIIGFILATVIRSLLPEQEVIWDGAAYVARRMLVVTLFLIGAGLSRAVLQRVGFRPLLQGVALWIATGAATLFVILQKIIV